eukprot:755029-Hanusia_phi.AAC.23
MQESPRCRQRHRMFAALVSDHPPSRVGTSRSPRASCHLLPRRAPSPSSWRALLPLESAQTVSTFAPIVALTRFLLQHRYQGRELQDAKAALPGSPRHIYPHQRDVPNNATYPTSTMERSSRTSLCCFFSAWRREMV